MNILNVNDKEFRKYGRVIRHINFAPLIEKLKEVTPCQAKEEGFRVSIILPKGTNLPLRGEHTNGAEDRLITAANKWLIAHPEGGFTGSEFLGLKGENLTG